MSAVVGKPVVVLLVVILVLSVVSIALTATLPREPLTVTMPITVPTVITVTQPGMGGIATVTVTHIKTVTQTVAGPGAPVRKLTIFFFDPAPANPWWDILAKGVEDAVDELKLLGIDVDYRRFDATTLDAQISQLQHAIALKPDVAVVGPISDAVQDIVKQLRQAGTKVILVDRDFPDQTARDLYLGTDNKWAAQIEAEAFFKWLEARGVPKPWKIVIFRGLPGIPTAYLRYQGFMEALKPYLDRGEAQVLEAVEVDPDLLPECYAKASAIVPKYGKTVTAYLATNLLQAMAIVQALKDNNLVPGKDIFVLGFDAQVPEWVDLIAAGQVAMSIQQHPYTMGYWGVWAGYFLVTGQMRLPEKAVINTPTYKVVPCNATYSLMLDYFKIPPAELLRLSTLLTPAAPQIHAPGYYGYNCG